ncbi:MAG: zinc ribbon domain-containing protein [Micrococcaceae bacterium]
MSNTVVRAYPHSIKNINAGKIAMLIDYADRYSKALDWFLTRYEYKFCTGQKVALQKLKQVDVPELYEFTGLTHAMYQAVQFQAMETYKSFTALLIKAVRREIYDIKVLSNEGRVELYKANLRNEWFTNPTLKSIVFQLVKAGKISFPGLKNTNTIKLTENICKIQRTKTATGFKYFAHISLPDDIKKKAGIRHRLIVPLTDNEHFLAKSKHVDKILDGIQLNMENMTATVFTKTKSVEKRETGKDIGLDWGLVNLLTDSNGHQYGQTFYDNLAKLDKILTECAKGLQRRRLRLSTSKRYRDLTKHIRGYIKTEVNRILNRIADTDIRSLTVEKLDFRSSKFSKRLNRIISKSGRAVLNSKLKDLTDTQGITVTEVKPEYTSQECNRCGYIDKKNRPTQARFKCLHCGYRLNADTNASRVIKGRRSIPELIASSNSTSRFQRKKTLDYLDNQFLARFGYSFSQATITPYKNRLSSTYGSNTVGATKIC